MYLHLSVIDLDLGRYASALEARKTARDVTREHFSFDPALLALADIFYSEIALERNDVEGLEDRISRALEQADRSESWSEAFLAGYQTCLALCFRRQDYRAAVDYVSRAETMIVVGGPHWTQPFGASAVVSEKPFRDGDGKVDDHFLEKAEALGRHIATLARNWNGVADTAD